MYGEIACLKMLDFMEDRATYDNNIFIKWKNWLIYLFINEKKSRRAWRFDNLGSLKDIHRYATISINNMH